jgi:fucose permease
VPRDRCRWLVPLAFLAFVSLGLPDGVLGVAWPSLRRSFDRPVDHLGLILLATMAGYLASSFSGGALAGRLGVGRLLLWSGLLVAASAATWALTPAWPPLLVGALASGLGAGAIDAGINAFAAAHFSPRVITWLHACWGLGAMLGPLGMTTAIASGLGWRAGYAGLAASLVALSLCFRLTLRLWDSPDAARPGATGRAPSAGPAASVSHGAVPPRIGEALRSRRVRRNVVVFYVYTGIEATAGQWAYTLLTESRGMSAEAAGIAAAAYWGSIFAGRIAFGALAHHVAPATILRLATTGAPLLAAALALSHGSAAASATLSGLGLLLAPIFPLLIAETPGRVGERHAPHAIGFQVAAATLGAGTLPALAGLLMRRAGLEALGPFLLAGALLLLVARSRNAAAISPSTRA